MNTLNTSKPPKWLKDISGSFFLNLLARLLGVANATLLARILQPQGYGLYSYTLVIAAALALLAQFGIPTVVMREVAAKEIHKKWGEVRGVIRWAYGGVGALTLAILAATIAVIVYNQTEFGRIQLVTYISALPLVPLLALDEIRIAILSGLRHIVLSRVLGELLRSLIVFLSLAFFTWQASDHYILDASGAMVIMVGASVVALILGSVILNRVQPYSLKQSRPVYACRKWAACSLPIAVTAGIGFINQSASTLIIGSFLSDVDVGYFRIAMLGAGIALVALTTINNGLAPYFSRSFAQADFKRLQELSKRSAQLSLAVGAAVVVIYASFGDSAISLLFGEAYDAALTPMLILAVGQLVTAATGSAGMILYMTGRAKEASIGAATGACVNIIFNIILVPKYGVIGAACATALGEAVWSIAWFLFAWRRLGIVSAPVAFGRNCVTQRAGISAR